MEKKSPAALFQTSVSFTPAKGCDACVARVGPGGTTLGRGKRTDVRDYCRLPWRVVSVRRQTLRIIDPRHQAKVPVELARAVEQCAARAVREEINIHVLAGRDADHIFQDSRRGPAIDPDNLQPVTLQVDGNELIAL